MDMTDKNLLLKYKDKLIYKYDFMKFREDGFSKDVFTLSTNFNEILEEERLFKRTLIALIVSDYRRFVAGEFKLNLKPVVLVKLDTKNKTKEAMEYFFKRIESLNENDIKSLESDEGIFGKAIGYFKEKNLVSILKVSFNKEVVHIATDNTKEDYILQTMEVNNIRLVYDCDRLNEGWDVLNLFDIVRLYETRSESKTTKEVQLIGRGARYFPFEFGEKDKYKRKFDNDLENKLRCLEQMHFHCQKEPKYLYELREALVKGGIQAQETETFEMKVKEEFKKTALYKEGFIYKNKKVVVPKNSQNYRLDELIEIKSEGFGIKEVNVFEESSLSQNGTGLSNQKLISIEKHKLLSIMDDKAFCDFFSFKNLKQKFEINSRNDFLEKIKETEVRCETLKEPSVLKAVFSEIKKRIENNFQEYQGTEEFCETERINNVVVNQILTGNANNEDFDFLVQENMKLTTEEESLLQFIKNEKKQIEGLEYFYIIRNEGKLKIYNIENGKGTEPDFILLAKFKENKNDLKLQIFIEPKGDQFKDNEGGFENSKEGWKQKLLEELNQNYNKTQIQGLFYNKSKEREFRERFNEIITKAQ